MTSGRVVNPRRFLRWGITLCCLGILFALFPSIVLAQTSPEETAGLSDLRVDNRRSRNRKNAYTLSKFHDGAH